MNIWMATLLSWTMSFDILIPLRDSVPWALTQIHWAHCVYDIVFRQTSLKILSPLSNENCFCAQSVFCPFDSWLTYFATTVIIEYWNIFQWPLLQRPNVFTRFLLYGMCQNEDYTRHSLNHTLHCNLHCTTLHISNSPTATRTQVLELGPRDWSLPCPGLFWSDLV